MIVTETCRFFFLTILVNSFGNFSLILVAHFFFFGLVVVRKFFSLGDSVDVWSSEILTRIREQRRRQCDKKSDYTNVIHPLACVSKTPLEKKLLFFQWFFFLVLFNQIGEIVVEYDKIWLIDWLFSILGAGRAEKKKEWASIDRTEAILPSIF